MTTTAQPTQRLAKTTSDIEYVVRAWTETIPGPGVPLYIVCVRLPTDVVVVHRPLKSFKQAKALERDMDGWTGSVVLTTGWTVRP